MNKINISLYYSYSFIVFMLLTISMNASSLSLEAEVDRSELANNESLRLIITTDESAATTIDFSELLLQFDIINTQRSNQTSIINGKVSASTQWILILSPKESGQLLIPSFEYKGVYSQAITITVNDSSLNNNNNNSTTKNSTTDKDVFLQLTVNKNTVYVQEQILVTLRLFYKTALSNYDDETLQIDNTTVTLVSENNFRSDMNGVSYNVLEKIYALHPQSSGAITIPEQSWRLEKALNRFNFGRSGNPYLYVRSAPATVNVKPIAETSTADTWLPSTAVTLDAKWKQSILEAKVGEPLNYQLILIANGLTAAQLPEIVIPNTDKFTIYSNQPDVDNNKSSAGIIGTRISNFAVIPRETGRFTFPEVIIKWWNTTSNREETTSVAAQTIVVVNPNNLDSDKIPTLPWEEQEAKVESSSKPTYLLWKILTLLFALSSVLLAYILFIKNKKTETPNSSNPKTPKDNNKKELIKHIEDAISHEDSIALRAAVLRLGAFLTHKKTLVSLNEFSDAYPQLRLELTDLDNHTYGRKQKDEEYKPDNLLVTLRSLKKVEKKTTKSNKLKALYPLS